MWQILFITMFVKPSGGKLRVIKKWMDVSEKYFFLFRQRIFCVNLFATLHAYAEVNVGRMTRIFEKRSCRAFLWKLFLFFAKNLTDIWWLFCVRKSYVLKWDDFLNWVGCAEWFTAAEHACHFKKIFKKSKFCMLNRINSSWRISSSEEMTDLGFVKIRFIWYTFSFLVCQHNACRI